MGRIHYRGSRPVWQSGLSKTHRSDYLSLMPTVHREEGFAFRIYTDDHPPPHVHVVRAGTMVVVEIEILAVREVHRMPDRDIVKAVRLVEEHREAMLRKWKEIHG